jgi:hypothetical protein
MPESRHPDPFSLSAAGSARWYIVLLAVVIVGAFVYDLRFRGIFACSAAGYTTDHYLAYCNSASYNDYDHGAFWFGLEEGARQAAASAQALFVGSSRMEFGFSSTATREWFAERAATFYLLGFSYSENVTFTEPLLGTLAPRAAVYVINVDRFFETEETVPAAEIFHGDAALSRHHRKRLWQGPHRMLCSAAPFICGDSLAFFRDATDGTWTFRGSSAALVPGDIREASLDKTNHLPQRVAAAKAFVAGLAVDPRCVLLTVVPSGATPRAEAEAIAAALDQELLAPDGDGLRTFDDSHLDPASAEAWSRDFFGLAGDRIAACLTAHGSAPQHSAASTSESPGLR